VHDSQLPQTGSVRLSKALADAKLKSTVPSAWKQFLLPNEGYVRLPVILGDPKAEPPIPGIFPVSKSTWWNGVRDGIYPAPVKLSPRVTAWRVEDIRALLDSVGQ
jgi:hypothetical protein